MGEKMDIYQLEDKVTEFRKKIMEVGYLTKSGHLSSALSCTEVMVALYYGGFLAIDSSNYNEMNRNRFVLSKGHACIIQYLILNDLGLIADEELMKFCKPDGILGAHPDCLKLSGIEATTGALGHGLSIAIGYALGAKYNKQDYQTYTILGDGECEEGSVWEAALCAGHHKLDNLTVIVDYNKLQASDYTSNITTLDSLPDKWTAFGFDAYEIDGNNMDEVMRVLSEPTCGKPKAIIAHTIKGKGVTMIENQNNWHGRKPNDEEWISIRKQMGM